MNPRPRALAASQPPALLAARAQPPALLVAPAFSGKKALVVDDDVRNIFAITSVLERYQMSVVYAEDGRRGTSSCASTRTSTWS